jgi:hypothetical protein
LDDYAERASQYIDAPTVFQKALAYWTLGSAIGKRVYYQFGSGPVFPNMFLVLVGRSGMIRKSTTKNFALDVLDKVCPEIDLPGRGSPEAFRDALDEKGWYGVLHYDEFYEFLAKRKKDYNADMDTTIMELFSHGRKSPIRTKTSGEIRIPADAVISFIAPTTLDLFVAGLAKDDLLSGLMARFMLIEAEKDIQYAVPPPMPDSVKTWLATKMKELIPNVQNAVEIKETPEARGMLEAMYDAINERVKETKNSLFGEAFNRGQVYALKLAMIHAIAEKRLVLEQRDYEAVMPFITNWAEALKNVVERVSVEDRFQEQIAEAERFLRDHPKTTSKALQGYMRLRKYEMQDLVHHLTEAGLCEVMDSVDASGKTTRIIKYSANGVLPDAEEPVVMLSRPTPKVSTATVPAPSPAPPPEQKP